MTRASTTQQKTPKKSSVKKASKPSPKAVPKEENKSSTRKRDSKLIEKMNVQTPGKGVRFEEDQSLIKPASVRSTKKKDAALAQQESCLSPAVSPAKRSRG